MAWRRTVAKWNPRSNTLALCVTVLALAWRGGLRANRDRRPQRESASGPLQRIPSDPTPDADRAAVDVARATARERILPREDERGGRGLCVGSRRARDRHAVRVPGDDSAQPRRRRVGEHDGVWRRIVA